MNSMASQLAEYQAKMQREHEERLKQQALDHDEIGARLKLPELLEKRRREFNIPEAAFKQSAVFDRILVYQVSAFGETYGKSGLLVKHVTVKDNEDNETPRGVIVSAGLHARDVLWGHGMEVGHLVTICHIAPWRLYLNDTYSEELVILRDGDLLASEDVCELERTGVLQVRHEFIDDGRGNKKKTFVYFDTRTNEIRVPWAPAIDNQL